MSTLRPGDRIERYVIEAPLGEGGMGRVYRAHDERLDRRVALKVLITDGEDGSEGRVRMLREARAAATLDHPNVVQVYDVGEADGSPFIAMELVLGRSLRAMIGERSTTVPERVKILVGVASALAAAHDGNIVHRDVKPENVIVRPDGRVKVLDFGIARRSRVKTDPTTPTAAHLATLTAEGVKIGTPMYMAPEQIRGDDIDGRADQFAWGVTAYELLAGRSPWIAHDAMALMAAILTEEPVPLDADIPEDIGRIVRRAISKKPADRFASMHEIIEALTPKTDPAPAPRSQGSERISPASAPPKQRAPSGPPLGHSAPSGAPPGWNMAPPPPAPMLSRRYSPKELEEILDRALRLQPSETPTGYRYEEIADAAREVGIDEPTLAAAMRDMVKRGVVEAPESDRLRSRNRFMRHFGIWAAFAGFFFLINLSDNLFDHGRGWWFEFPVISWGVLLAVHAVLYLFPTPKIPQPLARRSPDPRIEYDARNLSTFLATRAPRVRVASMSSAPGSGHIDHRPHIASRSEQANREADAEQEADLEIASRAAVRRTP